MSLKNGVKKLSAAKRPEIFKVLVDLCSKLNFSFFGRYLKTARPSTNQINSYVVKIAPRSGAKILHFRASCAFYAIKTLTP